MAVEFKENEIVLTGRVYENELLPLKEFMDSKKSALTIDLRECDDLHGGVIQLLSAYKAVYHCDFLYSDKKSTYKMALEGFRSVEDDCNK